MTGHERNDHWQQQLDNWRHSGLSGAAFCKRHELPYAQFTYWRRKLTEGGSQNQQPASMSGFARVSTLPSHEPGGLTVMLPGGMAITGLHAGNVDLLGTILRQL